MNLIFVWNEDYLNKEKYRQTGFGLSTKYDVKYDIENNEVTVIQNPSYISGFWGENIFDVMAIVGDNGSGKTMLLNYIMDIFRAINVGNAYDLEFFVVFEECNKLKVVVTSKYRNIKVCPNMEHEIIIIDSKEMYVLSQYKFGYFTNALSLNDYQSARSGYSYDASLGGLIKNIAKEDQEMYYKKIEEDNIPNYFTNQFRRVIEFLYKGNPEEINIGFKLPKRIDIYINKSIASDEYIDKAIEEMREKNEEINMLLPKQAFRLKWYLKIITDKYSYTWASNLLISLVVNLFRELCVDQKFSDKYDKETIVFLNLLKDFKQKKKKETTIYDEIVYLINNVEVQTGKRYQCKKYKDFILWLKENEAYINEGCGANPNCCVIPLDDKHKKFIMELLEHYKKTSFVFPYFVYRLGLSTGELNFLNLYANMYNMLSENKDGKMILTNYAFSGTIDCTNMLLALDEADLSLHPKWQQKYLYWLLEFIKSVFPMCQVHVIIATHSPIMLSDFPNENILYLDDKCADIKRNVKTFGSNIHDLFLDSFFLSSTGTIGEFAEQKIKEIVNQLNNEELIDAEKENILKIIHSVGDDVVRNKLLQLYSQKANKYIAQEKKVEDSDTIDMTINLLKMQKDQIERMIVELEQKKK